MFLARAKTAKPVPQNWLCCFISINYKQFYFIPILCPICALVKGEFSITWRGRPRPRQVSSGSGRYK